jgi:hypothetical protein
VAAREDEPVRRVARDALYGLRGEGVDARLVEILPMAPATEQREIILAIAERRVAPAAPALLALAEAEDRSVRREACQALTKVARAEDLPALVDLLRRQPAKSYEDVLVGATLRLDTHPDRMAPVMAALQTPEVSGAARAALLRVLGRVGEPGGLALILEALKSDDADMRTEAIRALSLWPTPAPKERLYALAQSEQNMSRHVLALRGFIHMATLGIDEVEQGAHDLERAWAIARRDDEKRMVLAALPKVACLEALTFARAHVGDVGLQGEAQNALVALGKALAKQHPQPVRAALEDVVTQAAQPGLRDRAQALLQQMK